MFAEERVLHMRITESNLRRVIRQILAEVSKKNNYMSYDDFKKENEEEVESLINSIANRIYNEQTGKNAEALEKEYKKMCLNAGLAKFADEIINDAYERHNDPY
tara:strand:- start:226 stop:537 length:312 start_codon:yes stop_codon:yes gene_type:complete